MESAIHQPSAPETAVSPSQQHQQQQQVDISALAASVASASTAAPMPQSVLSAPAAEVPDAMPVIPASAPTPVMALSSAPPAVHTTAAPTPEMSMSIPSVPQSEPGSSAPTANMVPAQQQHTPAAASVAPTPDMAPTTALAPPQPVQHIAPPSQQQQQQQQQQHTMAHFAQMTPDQAAHADALRAQAEAQAHAQHAHQAVMQAQAHAHAHAQAQAQLQSPESPAANVLIPAPAHPFLPNDPTGRSVPVNPYHPLIGHSFANIKDARKALDAYAESAGYKLCVMKTLPTAVVWRCSQSGRRKTRPREVSTHPSKQRKHKLKDRSGCRWKIRAVKRPRLRDATNESPASVEWIWTIRESDNPDARAHNHDMLDPAAFASYRMKAAVAVKEIIFTMVDAGVKPVHIVAELKERAKATGRPDIATIKSRDIHNLVHARKVKSGTGGGISNDVDMDLAMGKAHDDEDDEDMDDQTDVDEEMPDSNGGAGGSGGADNNANNSSAAEKPDAPVDITIHADVDVGVGVNVGDVDVDVQQETLQAQLQAQLQAETQTKQALQTGGPEPQLGLKLEEAMEGQAPQTTDDAMAAAAAAAAVVMGEPVLDKAD